MCESRARRSSAARNRIAAQKGRSDASYGTSPISSNTAGLNLFCPRPAFEEAGDVNTRGSGLQCGQAVLTGGEPPRFGGQNRRSAHRVWQKPFFPLLGRSSEAFI